MNISALTSTNLAAPPAAPLPVELAPETATHRRPRGLALGFWLTTSLFCLQLGFTAYAQLRLPQVADAFTHLGFPAYFRIEVSWAKLLGLAVLLAPAPARLKEWAYAAFAIDLGSAIIAHLAVGDGVRAWGWAAGTGVLWGLSYYFWRRLEGEGTKASLSARSPSGASAPSPAGGG